ncbi:MAG: CHASE2 domain-containing protein [Dongiaceae bacterium]
MIALLAANLGVLTPLEHRLMDFRFGLVQRPASGGLVVVEMDNASLDELGVWPWPRSFHAALIEKLVAAGARDIAFDVDLSSVATPDADRALADAMARAGGRVVLPVFRQHASLAPRGGEIRYTLPLPLFRAHSRPGSVNLQPGDDSLVRLYALTDTWDGASYPSIGAAIALIPEVRANDFYLDFGIRVETLPRVSYVDVLRGRVDAALLRDRLIIVGATAIELGDQAATPIHRLLPGVVVQALGYESIVQDRMILRSSPLVTWGIAVAFALLLGVRFLRWPWRAGLFVVISGSVGLVGLSVALQAATAMSLDIVAPIIVLWVSYLATMLREIDTLAVRIFQKSVALLERNATMRALLEDSFDGIVIADESGCIEIVNPTAAHMLAERADALAGRPVAALFADAGQADGAVLITASELRPAMLRRSDGARIPVELVVSRSQVKRGTRRFERRDQPRIIVVYTFRDATERRRAEEAQKAALQEAIAASRAKSEFLSNMSHELRTPLNAIIGFSDIIKEELLGPLGNSNYVAYAADIHASSVRLCATLNSILDISRLEGGRYRLREDAVALDEAIAGAVGVVHTAAREKATSIESRISGDPPTLRVDARAVQQVLVNLLSNAVKFTGQNGRVAVSAGLDLSGNCVVSITDDGIGIPREQLGRVTKAFHQVDASLGRKYEGLGLGLSLAAGLMELHDGSLSIDSEVDVGTTVTLRFPAARVQAA